MLLESVHQMMIYMRDSASYQGSDPLAWFMATCG